MENNDQSKPSNILQKSDNFIEGVNPTQESLNYASELQGSKYESDINNEHIKNSKTDESNICGNANGVDSSTRMDSK